MTYIEMLLSAFVALFGGLNIFQFIFWRAEKKRYNAEADAATADAKQKSIDLQQDQFDYLLEKLTKYQNDYFELDERLRETTSKHSEEINDVNQRYAALINEKCNELAVLKSKLVYFKGLRCYDSNCPRRIKDNPKDSVEKDLESKKKK